MCSWLPYRSPLFRTRPGILLFAWQFLETLVRFALLYFSVFMFSVTVCFGICPSGSLPLRVFYRLLSVFHEGLQLIDGCMVLGDILFSAGSFPHKFDRVMVAFSVGSSANSLGKSLFHARLLRTSSS